MEFAGSIRCSSVEISTTGISEYDANNAIVFVPREIIVEVTLLYGTGAQRPKTQTIVSLLLMATGVFLGFMPVYHFVTELASIQQSPHLNNYNLKPFVFASTFILIGVLLALDGLRRKYYLLIKCDKGNQKVVFGSPIKPAEISEFIDKAQKDLGYNIKMGRRVKLTG